MVRVLVCGGRRGVAAKRVFRILDDVAVLLRAAGKDLIEIGEGRAIGVDQAAGAWADHKADAHWKFPINSALHGFDPMTAPKRRNQQMLDVFHPDVCLAFPGGGGTNDMADRCHKAGVPVWDVEMPDDAGYFVTQWAPRSVTGRTKSTVVLDCLYSHPLTLAELGKRHLELHRTP